MIIMCENINVCNIINDININDININENDKMCNNNINDNNDINV